MPCRADESGTRLPGLEMSLGLLENNSVNWQLSADWQLGTGRELA